MIFAADNLMALGAMDAIRAHGLRIPQDIALAAFDDIPWFVHTDPPITAIAQPTGELGRAAVRALIDRLEGREPRSAILPAELVIRRSCGEPPPAVRAAAAPAGPPPHASAPPPSPTPNRSNR